EAETGFASVLPQLRSHMIAPREMLARAMLEHARLALSRAELTSDQLAQAETLVREAVVAAPGDQATLTLAQLERLRGELEQAERTLALLTGTSSLELEATLERGMLRLAQA